MSIVTHLVTAGLILLLATASPALGGAPLALPFPPGTFEFGGQLGYGITHRGFGATRTQVQTVDFIGRVGYFLSGEMGRGWYRGEFEHVLEIPLHLAVDPDTRVMTGGNLLAKWDFTGLKEKRLIPYLFAGGGVLFVDLGLPTMGSRLDFSYGGGTGVQYLVGNRAALSLEYRYHHISNASTAEPNEPLNSSKVLVGISVFR
ncbi:lipid A 3-O-deacylase [Geomonas sp. Red276]